MAFRLLDDEVDGMRVDRRVVGPQTNVALALRREPRLASWLKAITIMGGSTTVGNITPAAEFNGYADPEAAAAVYACGYSDALEAVGRDGCFPVPTGPGLGVTYDWDYIAKNRTNLHRFRL
ncbi:MAG: nucleoside hydrolase [Alphaproteobacteria bacterium]